MGASQRKQSVLNLIFYIGDVLNSKDAKVQQALIKSGLQKSLQAMVDSDGSAIFMNMPIRALVMLEIEPQVIQHFIELTK